MLQSSVVGDKQPSRSVDATHPSISKVDVVQSKDISCKYGKIFVIFYRDRVLCDEPTKSIYPYTKCKYFLSMFVEKRMELFRAFSAV